MFLCFLSTYRFVYELHQFHTKMIERIYIQIVGMYAYNWLIKLIFEYWINDRLIYVGGNSTVIFII